MIKSINIFIITISIITTAYAKKSKSCYSVQLLSSKNKIHYLKTFPKNSKIFYIGGFYTLRNGCYDTKKEVEKNFQKLSKDFPEAIVTLTYRYRFDEKSNNSTYPWEQSDLEKMKKDIKINITSDETDAQKKIQVKMYKTDNKQHSNTNNLQYNLYSYPFLSIYSGQTPIKKSTLRSNIQKIKLGIQYEKSLNRFWNFYGDIRLIPYRIEKNGIVYKNISYDIKSLYISSEGLNDNRSNLLLGRKKLKDKRSWLYDASLDSIGIYNKHDLLKYEIYAGSRLDNSLIVGETSSSIYNLKNIRFLIGHVSYEYLIKNTVELFYLYEHSKSYEDRDMKWFGFRTQGDMQNSSIPLVYWFDFAKVNGSYIENKTNKYARGIGIDIGAKYYLDSLKNFLCLSFAYGSGGENKKFVQPYMSSNRSDYLKNHIIFRYYGSFFKPKLTNIQIASLYLYHQFTNIKNISTILALHNYRQVNASTIEYEASSYTMQPNGKDKDLGNELDIIIGKYIPQKYNIRFVFAYFLGSDAFNGVTKNKDGIYGQLSFRHTW